MFQRLWHFVVAFAGLEGNNTSHREKFIAAVGAGLGIAAVTLISTRFIEGPGAGLMVASMGASAVLLFAVPHGTLSQPWAVCGGHLVCAFIGVACYRLLPSEFFAPALAVALAVAAMTYLRCIHPPGGATALAAVIGGAEVHNLGYWFLLAPVAANLIALMLVGIVFNNLFHWRRYPVALMAMNKPRPNTSNALHLSHEDLAAAMESLDTYVDVTSEELAELFDRAWAHARSSDQRSTLVKGGRCYSNGLVGAHWSVRQVIDLAEDRSRLIYKNVAGANLYETGICNLNEFKRWARFEVEKRGERWVKIAGEESVRSSVAAKASV